jgi:outer membrane protein assembly factor BamA
LYNSRVGRRSVYFLTILAALACSSDARTTHKTPLSYKLLSVRVTGAKHYANDRLIRASGLEIGHNASDQDFKDAVKRLGDTGLFTDVGYGYRYTAEGCDLELQVSENDKLVPILFDNFVWFSDDELISLLRSKVPLFDGKLPLRGELADQVADVLNAALAERKISGHAEYLESAEMNGPMDSYLYEIKFHPVVVRNSNFPGAGAAEEPALLLAAKGVSGQEYLRSSMRPHEKHDFLPVYLSRGYLKAQFSDSQAKIVEDGPRTVVDVLFPVAPGIQYRVSQFQWSGTTAFPASQLEGFVHLKAGEPANAIQLDDDLQAVQKLYGTKGYLMATVTPDASTDDIHASVAYELKVAEGNVFRMGDLQIDGISDEAAKKLAAQWQIKKGDVYDNSYLKRFFEVMYHDIGLNRSYSVVPKEKVNAEEKTVTVALHFVPKR